jgi:hypothetical protein
MHRLVLVSVLAALAGCDDATAEFDSPGLFEPYMFNDEAYNISFIATTPIEDQALLAQGFIASRAIEVFRMSGEPFGPTDAAEAAAVAAQFCTGGTLIFVPSADGIFSDDPPGFVFARNCLEREGQSPDA